MPSRFGAGRSGAGPGPFADFRHVLTVTANVSSVFDQFVFELLLEISAFAAGLRIERDDGSRHGLALGIAHDAGN